MSAGAAKVTSRKIGSALILDQQAGGKKGGKKEPNLLRFGETP